MSARLPVLVLAALLMVPVASPPAAAIGPDCLVYPMNPWCPGGWVLAWLVFLGHTVRQVQDEVTSACQAVPQCPW